MTVKPWSDELFDVVTASERLRALAIPLADCTRAAVDVLESAPELAPEMDAVSQRINEAVGHVLAAQAVLKARLANLSERT